MLKKILQFLFIILFYTICLFIENYLSINTYDNDLYRLSKYLILLEITTFINSIRLLANTFIADIIFIIIYFLIKPFVTIMLYYNLLHNLYFDYLVIPVGIIGILNTNWINIIVYTIKKNIKYIILLKLGINIQDQLYFYYR